MNKYTPTIGIETHVQLKTKTKLFAGVGNDAKGAKPNSLISHICVGMPGALPVLNKKAVELAVLTAYALNTKPQKFSKFDRKHYFYPDLPKGYQISQYDQPLILGGSVNIDADNQTKKIGITRVHLEEDAGKNIHPTGTDYSLVDLNRAGTPLLEIVSEPEIHSAAEAKAYVRELYLIMKYADVSDCDLYLGHMRFDVNVSLSSDPKNLGTRAEIKNLNSFRSVENAINYEIKRQTELLNKGEAVVQETRGWDEAKQKTTSQRGKEEAHDYRYMPEPDIPPIVLNGEFMEQVRASLPKLPEVYRQEFGSLSLDKGAIEDIISSPQSAKFLSKFMEENGKDHASILARWILHSYELFVSEDLGESSNVEIDNAKVQILTSKVLDKKIRSNVGLEIWTKMISEGIDPETYIRENKLEQVSDETEISKIVAEVLAENAKAANDVKAGEMKAIGFLVGQVMAKSKGQANPGLAQKLIKEQLGV